MEQNKREDMQGESRLTLDSRIKLVLTGATDIISFDDASVYLETRLGSLLIEGNGLHITDYSLEREIITVEGNIRALTYNDPTTAGGGFLRRIFG